MSSTLSLSLSPHYCSPTNLFLTYSNYVVYCENTRCVELHTMKAPSWLSVCYWQWRKKYIYIYNRNVVAAAKRLQNYFIIILWKRERVLSWAELWIGHAKFCTFAMGLRSIRVNRRLSNNGSGIRKVALVQNARSPTHTHTHFALQNGFVSANI